MSRVTISASAIDKISQNAAVLARVRDMSGHIPMLSYYRRCYSTASDGTITEHGDGFALSFVRVQDLAEDDCAIREPVAIGDVVDRLVLRPGSVLTGSLTIDYVGSAFMIRYA